MLSNKQKEFNYRDLAHAFQSLGFDKISVEYDSLNSVKVSVYSTQFKGIGMLDRIEVLAGLVERKSPDLLNSDLFFLFEGWIDRDEEIKYMKAKAPHNVQLGLFDDDDSGGLDI